MERQRELLLRVRCYRCKYSTLVSKSWVLKGVQCPRCIFDDCAPQKLYPTKWKDEDHDR